MSFTFFAKSFAYSWKISFAGHVLCQRIEIGPCAFAIIGKPSAAVPAAALAAPLRNLRRDAAGLSTLFIESPPSWMGDSCAARKLFLGWLIDRRILDGAYATVQCNRPIAGGRLTEVKKAHRAPRKPALTVPSDCCVSPCVARAVPSRPSQASRKNR